MINHVLEKSKQKKKIVFDVWALAAQKWRNEIVIKKLRKKRWQNQQKYVVEVGSDYTEPHRVVVCER